LRIYRKVGGWAFFYPALKTASHSQKLDLEVYKTVWRFEVAAEKRITYV
jgi:hypothetical protein